MAGRKRKQGKRTKGGQLSREGQRVKPSQWVQDQQERFGNHYSSALGRAYVKGLLGEGSDAKARLDAGNKFVLRYSKHIGGDVYTCPLGDRSHGNDNADNERDEHQWKWLNAAMDRLDKAGLRPWLDQLISRQFIDRGPAWLDRLLDGGKHPADKAVMEAANNALDMILAGAPESGSEAKDIPLHRLNAVGEKGA